MRALRRTHYPDKHLLAAPPMSADMLTLPELAEHLGCSVRTLHRRRTAAGHSAPHGTRMGHRLHFPRTAVESWAGEHLVSTRARSDGFTGRLLPYVVEPGSSEWMTRMSASKIAAVVGLSPYESRFAMWHRMAGLVPPEPESEEMRRGHLLEPAVAAWFADQHRDWRVDTTGTWVAPGADWMAASPDRLVTRDDGTTVLLECKSSSDSDEWGTPGTDEIPIGYRSQCLWQLHVTGATECHVAVLLPYLTFAEYLVTYDAVEGQALAAAGAGFMRSLPNGAQPQRPNLDEHGSTYRCVRELNPDIVDVEVPLEPALADEYIEAKADEKRAKARALGATTAVLDALGVARTATCDGRKIAVRIPGRGGNPPSLRASKQPTTERAA